MKIFKVVTDDSSLILHSQRKFDQVVQEITNGKTEMGVIEVGTAANKVILERSFKLSGVPNIWVVFESHFQFFLLPWPT